MVEGLGVGFMGLGIMKSRECGLGCGLGSRTWGGRLSNTRSPLLGCCSGT